MKFNSYIISGANAKSKAKRLRAIFRMDRWLILILVSLIFVSTSSGITITVSSDDGSVTHEFQLDNSASTQGTIQVHGTVISKGATNGKGRNQVSSVSQSSELYSSIIFLSSNYMDLIYNAASSNGNVICGGKYKMNGDVFIVSKALDGYSWPYEDVIFGDNIMGRTSVFASR